LIEEFDYPRLGPGMMWNAVKEAIERADAPCASTPTWCASSATGSHVDRVVVGVERLRGQSTPASSIDHAADPKFVQRPHPPPR